MSRRQILFTLAGITTVGFLLRLFFIFHRGPFWFDEAWSVHFSSLPWTEALRYWIIETNPFLHTLIMRGIIFAFGANELPVRIFSLLVGTACIPLTYYLARILSYEHRVALTTATLVAIAQNQIFISSEARGYALLSFLTITSFILLFGIITEKFCSKYWLILYGITVTLLLFSHLTALILGLIHILILAHAYHEKRITLVTTKRISLIYLIALLLFLTWFMPSIYEKANATIFNAWYFSSANASAGNLIQSITNLFLTLSLNPICGLIFGVLTITAFAFFIVKTFREKNILTFQLGIIIWALLPPTMAACFGQNDPKFFGYALPAIALILAALSNSITDKKIRTAYCVILLIVPLIESTLFISGKIFEPNSIVQFLQKQATENTAILITPFNEILTWQRYYHGHAPLIPAYPYYDSMSLDERIARFNWQRLPITNDALKKWYFEEANVGQYEKILYITPYETPEVAVTTLLEMGWRYSTRNIDPMTENHYIKYFVYELFPPIATTTATTNEQSSNR